MPVYDAFRHYVALGKNGAARPLEVTKSFWPDLIAGKLGELERLISCYEFESDWDSWEVHPNGEEFVCLISGWVDFTLDVEGERTVLELRQPGAFVIVPRGAWHTAAVHERSRMIFVTAGEGTRNRPAG